MHVHWARCSQFRRACRPAALAAHLGCAFDDGPLLPAIRVDAMRQTTVPGVYAAGDAASPMHSVTLAIAAGVIAGAGAHQSLVAEAAGGAPAR